ncbi:MAG: hypothetical protein IPL61_34440 [Myxococcales bacterium]|nr:hypothetical protein [Myxococcales bacterium]
MRTIRTLLVAALVAAPFTVSATPEQKPAQPAPAQPAPAQPAPAQPRSPFAPILATMKGHHKAAPAGHHAHVHKGAPKPTAPPATK